MKKLLLLLVTAILSFNAYGEYTGLGQADDGKIYSIDFDTIKERGGYVYWWGKTAGPDFSYQTFYQGDCDFVRLKALQSVVVDSSLGEFVLDGDDDWIHLPPDSAGTVSLELSCYITTLTPKEKTRYIEELIIAVSKFRAESQASSNNTEGQEKEGDNEFNKLQSSYIGLIAARVKDQWRYMGAEDDWGCDVYIIQDEDGYVEAVNVQDCTVDDSYQAMSFKNSIERAVYKSSPLPLAPDQSVFDTEIMFQFRVN